MRFLSLCLLIFPISANALVPTMPPNIEGGIKVGRMLVFDSDISQTWVLPTAFSSDLSCSPGTVEFTTCQLRVLNTPTVAETNDLEMRNNVGYMSPFDAALGMTITERFEPSALTGTFKQSIAGQMAVLPIQTPYASLSIRLKSEDRDSIVQTYEATGLGKFHSDVSFDSIRIFDHLAISNPDVIRAGLIKTDGRIISRAELESQLQSLVGQLQLVSANPVLTSDKAEIAIELRKRFFVVIGKGKYRLVANALPSNSDPLVLRDSHVNGRTSCHIELVLKRGAVPAVKCNTQ